jgi:hypothetical protein
MQERHVPVDTLELRLECAGLTVGDFWVGDFSVPSFQVQAGQAICLHVPAYPAIWHENLKPILSGRTAHPALHLHGSVSYLERPMPRRHWWGKLYNPSTGDWLTTEKGLASAQAAAVLSLVGESPDMRVGRLGWRERTLLALEATLLRPPGLLVFDTVGNDPQTIQQLLERLASRPPSLALLYLKTRRGTEDPCLPGAVCLEMVRAPSPTARAE